MITIDKIYINGQFIKPQGTETIDIINPTNNEVIGKVVLGNEVDTRIAVKSAKAAFNKSPKSSKEERINYLQKLHDAIIKRVEERDLFQAVSVFLLKHNTYLIKYLDSLSPYIEGTGENNDKLSSLKVKEAIMILLETNPLLKNLLFDFNKPQNYTIKFSK